MQGRNLSSLSFCICEGKRFKLLGLGKSRRPRKRKLCAVSAPRCGVNVHGNCKRRGFYSQKTDSRMEESS